MSSASSFSPDFWLTTLTSLVTKKRVSLS